MDALISGRAGRALLLDGDSLKSFDVDEPARLVPRHQSDLPYLFGETHDLRVLQNRDIESVQQELRHDCDWNWSLDLTLISLDAELPDDIRREAIEGLDALLADSRVVECLENILHARPLPADADLAGALKLCSGAPSSHASALLERLAEHQLDDPLIVERIVEEVDDMEVSATIAKEIRERTDRSKRLICLLVGGGIGAILALLFAPKSGSELRSDIADVTRKGINRSREAASYAGTRAGEHYGAVRDKAGEWVGGAREAASRKGGQVAAAIEAGKQAYAEEKRRTEPGVSEAKPTYPPQSDLS